MSKYGNRKITKNGMTFDSLHEYKRYSELSLLERAGAIRDLRRQVRYVLIPVQRSVSSEMYKKGEKAGEPKPGKLLEREVVYIADFVYLDAEGNTVVEDAKGLRTKDYIIKRKLMLYVYGLRVLEV